MTADTTSDQLTHGFIDTSLTHLHTYRLPTHVYPPYPSMYDMNDVTDTRLARLAGTVWLAVTHGYPFPIPVYPRLLHSYPRLRALQSLYERLRAYTHVYMANIDGFTC